MSVDIARLIVLWLTLKLRAMSVRLIAAVARWSGLPADIVRRPPVVPITDNYDRLFYEPDAVARSARYSHYIDDMHMLRTHTTAGIPPSLAETRSDRLIVCPGLVYRSDVIDRLHVGEPHQVDLWIARQTRLRRAHLLEMIAAVVETVLPGKAYRCNETIVCTKNSSSGVVVMKSAQDAK